MASSHNADKIIIMGPPFQKGVALFSCLKTLIAQKGKNECKKKTNLN
jgi:hypothetical protein